jgi:hypothetical protein
LSLAVKEIIAYDWATEERGVSAKLVATASDWREEAEREAAILGRGHCPGH